MDFCRGTYRAETRNSVCGARALWSCGHQWSSSRLHCIDSVPHANNDYRIRTSRLTTSICSTNRGRSVYGVQLCKLTISLCFVQQAPSMSTPPQTLSCCCCQNRSTMLGAVVKILLLYASYLQGKCFQHLVLAEQAG